MIKLNKNKYFKVLPGLRKVEFNYLFAQAVLKNVIEGDVYVDNEELPKSFYILHPYGLSLLFGNENNEMFNQNLTYYLLNTKGQRNKIDWLQVYPYDWNNKLTSLLGSNLYRKNNLGNIIQPEISSCKIIENTRVNFKFSKDIYVNFRKEFDIKRYEIFPTNEKLFNEMSGSVIPNAFWRNAKQFEESGIGFSVMSGGKLASTAYSAFIDKNQLEIGIETVPSFYGKGMAKAGCCALIDYCLKNNYEPVWSCRLENKASYNLAQKLGFKPEATRPFYKVNI